MAAYGGIQYIKFERNEDVVLKRINIGRDKLNELNDLLLMFYTGIERKSVDIHKEQSNNIEANRSGYDRMRDIALETSKVMKENDFLELGKLMDENWGIKKRLSKDISQSTINKWYSDAVDAGAIGGKLMGAGGGGFLLFLTPVEKQKMVMNALHDLERHRIQIENFGSRVVYLE